MADQDEKVEDTGGSPAGTVFLLGLIFLPAGVTAAAFYALLRFGRMKLSAILQIFAVFELVLVLAWMATGSSGRLGAFFGDLGNIGQNWKDVLPAAIIFYMAVGALAGVFFCWWEIRQMRVNPHRLEIPGNWMYQFKFRRTFWELQRRKKHIAAVQSGELISDQAVPLGIDEEHEDSVVFRYYDEAPRHTLITGQTGSGKTAFTMLPLIRGDIENQVPLIIVDFKRDPELASKIATYTKEAGGKFYHFVNGSPADYDIPNSPGQCSYDPLAAAGPGARADMVLGMREYDQASAVYKASMQQLLQVTFGLVANADPSKFPADSKLRWNEGSIFQLASITSGENFTDLVTAAEHGDPDIYRSGEEILYQLKGKTQARHAMDELAGQIRTLVASEYGRWLKHVPGVPSIDLFRLTKEPGNVILFSLNSDSEPDFARGMGSLIMADITNVSARRRNEGLNNRVHVYVDEFQIVPPTAVSGLLEKSRASAIALTLAQQSFEQVVSSAGQNGEAYLLSILDTCGNFIIHSGSTQDSAERLSKILGKHWITKYRSTNKNQSAFLSINWKNKRDSVITTSDEEVWVFEPREFLRLTNSNADDPKSKATAVVINKTSFDPAYANSQGAVARRVWLVPRDDAFDRLYRPGVTTQVSHKLTPEDLEPVEQWEEIRPQEELDWRRPSPPREEDPFTTVESLPSDDDGDFNWTTVEEDSDEDLRSYRDRLTEQPRATQPRPPRPKPVSNQSPRPKPVSNQQPRPQRPSPSPAPAEKKPESGLPSLSPLESLHEDPLAQWDSATIAPPPKKRTSPRPNSGGGLPRPTGGGLPRLPQQASRPASPAPQQSLDDEEEIPLPDL